METHLPNKFLLRIKNVLLNRSWSCNHHIKCEFIYFSLSKSLLSKLFGIITSHNCLTGLRSETTGMRMQNSMTAFVIAFRLLQVTYYIGKRATDYWQLLVGCKSGCSNFLLLILVPVSQKFVILFF